MGKDPHGKFFIAALILASAVWPALIINRGCETARFEPVSCQVMKVEKKTRRHYSRRGGTHRSTYYKQTIAYNVDGTSYSHTFRTGKNKSIRCVFYDPDNPADCSKSQGVVLFRAIFAGTGMVATGSLFIAELMPRELETASKQ